MNSRSMFTPMSFQDSQTHTKTKTGAQPHPQQEPQVHLHVCTVQSGSRNLHSKFEKTFASETDAYELVNSYDAISVQQLGIEVAVKPSFTTAASTSFFTYLDICFAYSVEESNDFINNNNNMKKMVFFGHPTRVAITREASGKEVNTRLQLEMQNLTLSYLILSYLILSYLILSYLILSYLIFLLYSYYYYQFISFYFIFLLF